MPKTDDPVKLFAIKERLARRRVRRGVKWLNQNAPIGWQWNLFNLAGDGRTVYYRAHDSHDNECALALAFMGRAELANKFGYVTYGSVANKLGLHEPFLRSHGFHMEWEDMYERRNVLDRAWEQALRTYARRDIIPVRHETALERRYAESILNPLPRRTPWWRRLAAGFVNFGKAAEYAWGRFYSSPQAYRDEHRDDF